VDDEPYDREASANTHLLEIFAEPLLEKLSVLVENCKEQLIETINRIAPTLSLLVSIFAGLLLTWWWNMNETYTHGLDEKRDDTLDF
jgi:hypothetical protein